MTVMHNDSGSSVAQADSHRIIVTKETSTGTTTNYDSDYPASRSPQPLTLMLGYHAQSMLRGVEVLGYLRFVLVILHDIIILILPRTTSCSSR
jgi:hypothetical protein